VAREWYEIEDPAILYLVGRRALRHDEKEAASGDLPSIAKDLFDEEGLTKRYSDVFNNYDETTDPEDVVHIVKIADRLETILFLRREQALGNTTVSNLIADVELSMLRYFRKIGKESFEFRYLNAVKYGGWPSTGMKCHPMDRRET